MKTAPLPKKEMHPGEFDLARQLRISVNRYRSLLRYGGAGRGVCERYARITGRPYYDLLLGTLSTGARAQRSRKTR